MKISDIRRKIEDLLYKACYDSLEEEEFIEWWFEFELHIVRLGIGILRYKKGYLGFELCINNGIANLAIPE